jgi:hypothetical protein
MKNPGYYFILALFVLLLTSCEEELGKNTYGELFTIQFEGQYSEPVINREESTVSFQMFTDNLSEVVIGDMFTSVGATASTPVGGSLDFDNPDNSAELTLTSESGNYTKTYTIYLVNLAPDFVGDWKMTSGTYEYNFMVTYCDNGECSLEKPFDPSNFTNGAGSMDNTVSFTLDGFNEEEGIMSGQYTYGPGADGEMGSYEHTHATTSEEFDFNDNYGVLFTSGSWELNVLTNRIIFSNADGSSSIKTYTNYIDKKHWKMGKDADNTTDMFTFWLPVNRSGMLSASQAWDLYGDDDPTLAYMMGGFVVEFNMIK